MAGSVWKYYVSNSAPASANWKGGGIFDDSTWPQGQAPLGYSPNGEDSEVTRIPICPDPNCTQSSWTTYFRRKVFFNSRAYAASLPLADQRSLIINYKRDDGIVIYLNGTEIWRENMPTGIITHTTQASTAVGNEAAWQTVIVPLTNLREGENVLAAEVHQISQSIYADLRFDLEVVVSPYNYSTMTNPLSRVAAEGATQSNEAGVVVYPIPSSDGKVFFSPALPYQSYVLTDIQGRVQQQVEKPGMLEQLDLTNLPPGLYVLTSQGADRRQQFKLIRR